MVGFQTRRRFDLLLQFAEAKNLGTAISFKTDIQVLLIEDTPGDIRLIKEGFKRTHLVPDFQVAEDGEKALKIISDIEHKGNGFVPDLILLDLNLPLATGHEVLHRIKAIPKLDRTPVVILTSSLLEDDVARANAGKADLYMIKPINLNDYFAVIGKIVQFWMDHKRKRH